MHFTVLYCTLLFINVLLCAVQNSAVLYWNTLYSTVLYCTELFTILQYIAIHSISLHCIVVWKVLQEKHSFLWRFQNYLQRKKCKIFSLGSIISRPWQNQGLLYKHLRYSLSKRSGSLSQLYGAATPKVLEIGLPVIKKKYVVRIKNFLNPKGRKNPISGLKVMAILLKGLILPIDGVASGRVCACSLRSRLLFSFSNSFIVTNST